MNRVNRLKLKKDREGQASVVGTIMAIMIMLAFLSLITTQYVPISMTQYEAQHMNDVVSDFSNLRQNIDNLMIMEQTSMGMFSAMSMGTNHVPVFTAPTSSRLTFTPWHMSANITFDSSTDGVIETVTESGSGSVDLFSANRYYVPQSVIYENAAIIIRQENIQSVRANPHFDIDGDRLLVSLVTLIGPPSSYTGTETVGIQTFLHATDTWEYQNVSGDVRYTKITRNTDAWHGFFNNSMAGVTLEEVSPPANPFSTSAEDGYGRVVVSISGINSVVLTTSTVRVTMGA